VKIKATVARIGVGEKSQVRVTLHAERVVKGYVSELQDDAFVVREKKTGREQTVPYSAVAHIERGGNRIVEIAVGAGIVAVCCWLSFIELPTIRKPGRGERPASFVAVGDRVRATRITCSWPPAFASPPSA
jgi:hypothetical protein